MHKRRSTGRFYLKELSGMKRFTLALVLAYIFSGLPGCPEQHSATTHEQESANMPETKAVIETTFGAITLKFFPMLHPVT